MERPACWAHPTTVQSHLIVIRKIHLTSEALAWDPSSSSFSLQEDSMLNFRGQIVSTVTMTRRQITVQVNAVCSSPASYFIVDATDDNNFGIYLESYIHISLTTTSRSSQSIGVFTQTKWRPQCNSQPRGVYIWYQILPCPNNFGQMIVCYDTGTDLIHYSPIQCSLMCICVGIVNVHRCLHLTLGGYVFTLWRPKAKLTKSYLFRIK